MDKKTRDLYVFGYGISLIVPYWVIFHSLDLEPSLAGFLGFVLGLVLLMAASVKMASFKPIVNIWVYPLQLFALIQNLLSGISLVGLLFLGVAIPVLTLTIKDVEQIKPIYTRWMKLAHLLGTAMSAFVLGLLFILIFTPAGLILRLCRKDLLDRGWEAGKESYWHLRPSKEFNKESYRQQF